MHDALYGPDGFYRSPGAPARHFRTSVHTSPLWVDAIAELTRRVDLALGSPADFTFVDMGKVGGELVRALAATSPARWSRGGRDVAQRPDGLPGREQWRADPPEGVVSVIIACDLLDVV